MGWALIGCGWKQRNWFVSRKPVARFRAAMSATEVEKKKARRAILILYTCMIVGVGLPIVLYFALR
jgi:hypothetical protein